MFEIVRFILKPIVIIDLIIFCIMSFFYVKNKENYNNKMALIEENRKDKIPMLTDLMELFILCSIPIVNIIAIKDYMLIINMTEEDFSVMINDILGR